ncbi:Hmra1 protein [Saccharomycopsis crataegensis]|uniref:Hmra1 protein n=1 Tax=Saccharomycopsis crataegensis TaxID=43959 RepID=A0AAV5QU59_9ASCO|nr:Hmra1 protein [Saccharomycopsis crataegensis]
MKFSETTAITVGNISRTLDRGMKLILEVTSAPKKNQFSEFPFYEGRKLCDIPVLSDQLKKDYKRSIEMYQKSLEETIKLSQGSTNVNGYIFADRNIIFKRFEKELMCHIYIIESELMRDEIILSKLKYFLQSNNVNADAFIEAHNNEKKKSGRTRYSKRTTTYLESVFQKKRKLNAKERTKMSKESGLTGKQVRVWLTNRRARGGPSTTPEITT